MPEDTKGEVKTSELRLARTQLWWWGHAQLRG